MLKSHICSWCRSVSPLKSTLQLNAVMAMYVSRIINCSRVPFVETIYPISSFDELCITGLRRYLNRIELTYFVKISNIFPHIPLLNLNYSRNRLLTESQVEKKTKAEFMLHLTENVFMSILTFPTHKSQNMIIVGHTFLNSRFSYFPKRKTQQK